MYSLHFAFALCCHSSATRAPTANPLNSAQLGGIPYHSPKLHPGPWLRAMAWTCGRGQTDRQTDSRTHTQNTFRVVYDSHEMFFCSVP